MNRTITNIRAVEFASPRLHIEGPVYEALADALRDELPDDDYLPHTTVEVEDGDRLFRLIVSAIIYRRDDHRPEGLARRITDVIPTWCELHSYIGEAEMLNDATFDELKRYIIE